ncbi:MAG: hypothetical protein WCB94_20325 [Terriglobales bacterium]
MIFTASDVASLSSSLSRWEWGEYISEAFVIIACAGELVADLETTWLTQERKKHLQRRSTILLVAALSVALICLVRTNELSGSAIGSLGEKAEDADSKASKAITDSGTAQSKADTANTTAGDALTKAGRAAESLGKAEGEAKTAQSAASNALTISKDANRIASGARQEADTFEADIKYAKQQAADAETHLADALQRAANAEAELQRIKTPRSLTDPSAMTDALKVFKDAEYTVIGCFQDQESIDLLVQLDKVLANAGWKRVKPPSQNSFGDIQLNISKDFGVPVTTRSGVYVAVQSTETVDALKATPLPMLPVYIRAAMALKKGLATGINPAEADLASSLTVETGSSTSVFIIVGKKP